MTDRFHHAATLRPPPRLRAVPPAGPAPGDPPPAIEAIRAALAVLPRAATLSHQSAAALYGFGVVPPVAVHVTVPAGTPVPRRRGIAVHESTLRPAQIVDVRGLPCLPPARCAVDLARALPRPDALAVLDGALRARRCTPADLASELVAHGRLRGVRQARGLIGLATGLAGCRQESHLRLLLHDAGLPAPAPQLGVADERGLVRYRIALAYEEERVGVEYDGAPRPGRAPADRHRHNWLATRGWQLHHVTDADLYHSPQGLVATVRAGLRAARPAR